MDEPVEMPPFAWQPLTRRGVAAFARASVGRLLLVQFCVALLAAGTVVWFLQTAWFSTMDEAIARLPPQGAIASGALDWRGESPASLAENHFLALAVDLTHTGAVRCPAHVQVEFGRNDFEIICLGGGLRVAYPGDWVVAFNRTGLDPWWGAWRPAILALAAALVITGLMLSWALLATLYCLPAWLAGFFANRDLSLGGSWRLAGAALMPGALLLTVAILVYGLGALDLIELAVAAAGHIVLGWLYLFASSLSLPRHPATPAAPLNPFAERG
ncbi:MAG: hypothetical protein ABSF95_22895 [Verrucomicrobiota bacterium]|jgi:hypothetical protein